MNTVTKQNFIHKYFIFTILTMILLFTSVLSFFNFIQAEGPIEISTCLELQMIGNEESHPSSADYVLTQNINCGEGAPEGNDTRFWNPNADEWSGGLDNETGEPIGEMEEDTYEGVINNGYFGFEPIGDEMNPFTGTFDGNGNTISNLWMFRKTTEFNGLFAVLDGATVENLTLENIQVVGNRFTGGLAGRINNESVISDITVKDSMVRAYLAEYGGSIAGMTEDSSLENILIDGGTVHGSGNIIGGFVGEFITSSLINSTSSADVDGGYDIGGALGAMYNSSASNVHVMGNVLSEDLNSGYQKNTYHVGGFAGTVYETSEILNSSFSGTVTVDQKYQSGYVNGIGGFVGYAEGVIISNSHTKAGSHVLINSVSSVERVGGFVGELNRYYDEDTQSHITDSYARGNVTVNAEEEIEYVGGFAGEDQESLIENSYATGNVSVVAEDGEVESVGGFIGEIDYTLIENSYATGNVSAVAGGTYCDYYYDEDEQQWLCDPEYVYINEAEDIGGFVGYMYAGEIRTSYATGNVSGDEEVGGFAGTIDSGSVHDSYAIGDVSGQNEVGGFVGYATDDESSPEIHNSYATGDVSGNYEVGGFAGDFNYGSIYNSSATGDVTGEGEDPSRIGGFVGQIENTDILKSYATGNVSGYSKIGGFVGENDDGSYVEDSYARGSVTGTEYVGGFVGENRFSSLYNVYSTGFVIGTSNVGGLVGINSPAENEYDEEGEIIESYWDMQTSGQSQSDGGTGKTTAQMKLMSTFTTGDGSLNPFTLDSHEGELPVTYRFIAFGIFDTRNGFGDPEDVDNLVQMSELSLTLNGQVVPWPEGTIIRSLNGSTPDSEEPETPAQLIDGNLDTKWLDNGDFIMGPSIKGVIIDVGEEGITFDGYTWATGNDFEDRDPVYWGLSAFNNSEEISNNVEGWYETEESVEALFFAVLTGETIEDIYADNLDQKQDFSPTESRNTYVTIDEDVEGWDFVTIWNILSNKNNGYPFLRWSDPENITSGSILGCTNSRATNYNPSATVDNGSCVIPSTPRRSGFSGGRSAQAVATPTVTGLPTTVEGLRALLTQLQTQLAQLMTAQGQSTTPSNNSFTRDLKLNDQGEDVRTLQQLLISKGYAIPAGATGFFGTQTQSALIKFQQDNAIVPAAGYFGPVTRSRINQ